MAVIAGVAARPPGAEAPSSPSAQEARAALARLVASATFAPVPRLRSFLEFVSHRTLDGKGADLNEYLIGVEVFGKGDGYAPNDDPVVRRAAYNLRKKLEKYYAEEGRDDLVRVDLPVGGYAAVFSAARTSSQEAPLPAEAPPPAAEEPPADPAALTAVVAPAEAPLSRRLLIAAVGTGMLLGGGAVALVGRGRARAPSAALPKPEPALEAFWRGWLDQREGVTICFSNPMTAAIYHRPAGALPKADEFRLVPGGPEDEFSRRQLKLGPGGELRLAPSAKSQGKLSEAYAAVRLSTFLGRWGVPVSITQSHFLNWEVLRRQNVIVLGHNGINAWVDPLLATAPLRMAFDDTTWKRRIEGIGERGEAVSFSIQGEDAGLVQYALVSMLPGVRPGRRLLLLSGINSQATDIAAEYVTTAALAGDVVRAIEKAAGGAATAHFQMVIRAEMREGVPTSGSIEFVRPLRAPSTRPA